MNIDEMVDLCPVNNSKITNKTILHSNKQREKKKEKNKMRRKLEKKKKLLLFLIESEFKDERREK
jgi:hypothetical protein